MKKIFLINPLIILVMLNACAQSTAQKKVGGDCEGCEAIYENSIPFEKLNASTNLPDVKDKGPKIEISGIVYQRDGKTPAKDVIIYVYHTDQTGVYPTKGDEKGWAKRHGYIRGWMKTDEAGRYSFHTLRPAAYPQRRDPQHIHVTIKEPNKNEYWIDEYLFADDPLLQKDNQPKAPRGGNGVIKLVAQKDGSFIGKRDIILGLNIPGY